MVREGRFTGGVGVRDGGGVRERERRERVIGKKRVLCFVSWGTLQK